MKRARLRACTLLFVGLFGGTSSVLAQAAVQTPVSREQFAALGWLLGAWRGSGGRFPAFFEEYRLLNDSTIRQRAFADSTFTTVSDSSDIEWREGAVRKTRRGNAQYVVVRVTADSLQFARPARPGGGFVWIRESPDRWTALLAPPPGQPEPTIYRMQRLRP
ncbi:MAG: hypothetical protein HOP28_14610 [Gemmatimonadales bacterium]|nr:hypothetical protein [Gemmatimonadales bacterium]